MRDLNEWVENFGEIKTGTGGCNCVAWNPAFDEQVMIIVGCTSQLPSIQSDESLLLLYRLDGSEKKGVFKPYGDGDFVGHTSSINDVAWAPLAGRSFHLIVSSSADKSIIVWKMQTRDLFDPSGAMFEKPKVEKIFFMKPNA